MHILTLICTHISHCLHTHTRTHTDQTVHLTSCLPFSVRYFVTLAYHLQIFLHTFGDWFSCFSLRTNNTIFFSFVYKHPCAVFAQGYWGQFVNFPQTYYWNTWLSLQPFKHKEGLTEYTSKPFLVDKKVWFLDMNCPTLAVCCIGPQFRPRGGRG